MLTFTVGKCMTGINAHVLTWLEVGAGADVCMRDMMPRLRAVVAAVGCAALGAGVQRPGSALDAAAVLVG